MLGVRERDVTKQYTPLFRPTARTGPQAKPVLDSQPQEGRTDDGVVFRTHHTERLAKASRMSPVLLTK